MAYYAPTSAVPAYNPSDARAMAAWRAWRAANRGTTRSMVEGTANPYVSQDALRAQAQGGTYSADAARNAIANAIVQANASRDAGLASTGGSSSSYFPTSSDSARSSGSTSTGGGDSRGTAGGFSAGAGAGASQPGDASSLSVDALFGASTPSYDYGRPSESVTDRQASLTEDADGDDDSHDGDSTTSAALADAALGALTTSNASMALSETSPAYSDTSESGKGFIGFSSGQVGQNDFTGYNSGNVLSPDLAVAAGINDIGRSGAVVGYGLPGAGMPATGWDNTGAPMTASDYTSFNNPGVPIGDNQVGWNTSTPSLGDKPGGSPITAGFPDTFADRFPDTFADRFPDTTTGRVTATTGDPLDAQSQAAINSIMENVNSPIAGLPTGSGQTPSGSSTPSGGRSGGDRSATTAPSGSTQSGGGFTGFGATGGYEGSASMANTMGAVAQAGYDTGYAQGAVDFGGLGAGGLGGGGLGGVGSGGGGLGAVGGTEGVGGTGDTSAGGVG